MAFVDLPTLFAVTVFATAMSGVLLIYAWLMNRHTRALAIWAVSYFLGSTGTALIIARGHIDDFWSIGVANILLAAAYGTLWKGARSFENRTTSFPIVLGGAALWLVACQFEVFYASMSARIVLVSSIIASYTLATAFEFWRSSDRQLMSRWPLIVIFGVHAGVFFSRILWPSWLLIALAERSPTLSVIVFISFEILFHTFCAAFMLVFIAKERMEQRYKWASLIDPLTGIANRRAFVEQGTKMLRRLATDWAPAALIAFDLDRFKTINDTYGHPVGDRVLCVFCDVVNVALRPGDLFARIGGEEFACLLPKVSDSDALVIAERIRSRFAEIEVEIGLLKLQATVSAGIASTTKQNWDLTALMLVADQALYRAKAHGRNRVELVQQATLVASDVAPNTRIVVVERTAV